MNFLLRCYLILLAGQNNSGLAARMCYNMLHTRLCSWAQGTPTEAAVTNWRKRTTFKSAGDFPSACHAVSTAGFQMAGWLNLMLG